MAVDVKIPEVGESIREVQIAQWLKEEGEWVEKDEDVVEIDTEKATLQVPAPASGRLARILKKEGDMAEVGDTIAHLEEGEKAAGKDKQETEKKTAAEQKAKTKEDEGEEDEQRAQKRQEEKKRKGEKKEVEEERPAKKEAAAKKHEPQEKEAKSKAERQAEKPRLMPAARRALAEHDLKAEDVEATGPGGRLLKEDVLRHVSQAGDGKQKQREAAAQQEEKAPTPPAAAPLREEDVVPMSMIRRRIAQRLVEAQQSAALLTTFNEIDMSAVIDLRKRHREEFEQEYGIKLGFMSFFVKATIEALKRFPALNAEIDGTNIIYRNYYDIGIAVSGGKGLVVPVLRNAERMSFADIERQIAELAGRARDNKLKPEELEGGTFTITNGGIFGSLLSTPIVNPPQSGVLGLHAIQDRPVAREGQVVIRAMMYVALTYDHRIVDGREAVTFLRHIKEVIEEPSRMLIEV